MDEKRSEAVCVYIQFSVALVSCLKITAQWYDKFFTLPNFQMLNFKE
jgi:hypothetical protein